MSLPLELFAKNVHHNVGEKIAADVFQFECVDVAIESVRQVNQRDLDRVAAHLVNQHESMEFQLIMRFVKLSELGLGDAYESVELSSSRL